MILTFSSIKKKYFDSFYAKQGGLHHIYKQVSLEHSALIQTREVVIILLSLGAMYFCSFMFPGIYIF